MHWYQKLGPQWSMIARKVKTRTGKQIRERIVNRLDANIDKSPFTINDDILLMRLQRYHGNDWKKIAKYFKGRSYANLKNRFHSRIKGNLKILNFIERRDFNGKIISY